MFKQHFRLTSGKVTLFAVVGVALLLLIIGVISFNVRVPTVSADNLSTSVTVLNIPPQWTIDAQETYDSSTSTPTNVGDTVSWITTATDPNNDNYYLLICKTSASPTANASAAPVCAGGTWAVSAATVSGTQARISTTTAAYDSEKNDWYAWVCDGNSSLALCNTLVKSGVGTTGPSPFFVDHPPVFTVLSSTGNANPGGTITWSVTATTTDLIRGGDTVKLYICSTNGFTYSSTTASCNATTIATSSFVTINPTATYTIPVPYQDTVYPAYAFLTNTFNLAATSTLEGSSTPYAVNNVAPTVSASSITLLSISTTSPTLNLATPNATSGPFEVTLQVTDNNSCLNISSGNEIASIAPNVYRNGSGVGSTTCLVAGDYNPNNCYPSASPQTDFHCTQDAGSCSGSSDSTATFTCTFSLWYNADATDPGSVYASLNWAASAKATDDNGAVSPLAESTAGSKDLVSFLAFAVTQTSIAFGGLQPGQSLDPFNVSTSTTLRELGNVGIDESLYGSTMCTNWSALGGATNPDACDTIGFDSTRDIGIANQKAATSTVAYASSAAYTLAGSTTPVSVPLHIPKTIATSTPQSKDTLWAIHIPNTITVAGSYTGQNTITAVTSASANW